MLPRGRVEEAIAGLEEGELLVVADRLDEGDLVLDPAVLGDGLELLQVEDVLVDPRVLPARVDQLDLGRGVEELFQLS